MKFYINEVRGIKDADWDHECIGLFNNCNGNGDVDGWGPEYYENVTLIAYGIQLGHSGVYKSKRPFDGGIKIVNEHYDKIMIGSSFGTETIEADSVEEALKIFKRQEWKVKN